MRDDDLPLSPPLTLLQSVWRLNHAIERASARMERALGVTAQQRFIVRCVGRYPGVTAGRLAALLQTDRGALSTALNRLERKGLLARRRDPRDRRRVTLGLTAAGHALDVATPGPIEEAAAQLLASSSGDDVSAAVALLERLGEAVEAVRVAASPAGAARRERAGRTSPETRRRAVGGADAT